MTGGVYPGLDKDEPPHQFVEVDVVVQREDGGHAEVSQHGDAVAEDQHQDQHGVEEESPTWGRVFIILAGGWNNPVSGKPSFYLQKTDFFRVHHVQKSPNSPSEKQK